jgi:DNA-binding response OmpR family regulator
LEEKYDLVLLDVMLPEVDGFAICRELRKESDVPIIFITARHQENDRLYGYHLGSSGIWPFKNSDGKSGESP